MVYILCRINLKCDFVFIFKLWICYVSKIVKVNYERVTLKLYAFFSVAIQWGV